MKALKIFLWALFVGVVLAVGFIYHSISSLTSDDAEAIYAQYFEGNAEEVTELKGTAMYWLDYSASVSFTAKKPVQLKDEQKYKSTACSSGMLQQDSPFAERAAKLYKEGGHHNTEYFNALDKIAASLKCTEYKGDEAMHSWLVRDPKTGEHYFYIARY